MSALSDSIEQFIISLITEGGSAELKRNQLAVEFDCAPSQINYVLSTRFTVQRGYVVESRRGGGGYIKVLRIPDNCNALLISAAHLEEDKHKLTKSAAYDLIARMMDCGAVDIGQAAIMKAALSDEALAGLDSATRNRVRAGIFQSMAKALTISNQKG